MADYQPIDLSRWCNAGVELLGGDERDAVGSLSMRGLPFLVGADGADAKDRCFIALAGSDGSVTIPIDRPAHGVVFAHLLLEASEGPSVAKVAEYVFHLSGGVEERVPIRERSEIGVRGGAAYRAVVDQQATLMARYEGSWGESGRRAMEAGPVPGRWYHLWAWRNPDPARTIESLEIVPRGPRFMVAAITLGHVDEHPFVREGRRPARILLSDPADAARPFDLDVEVDRGDATYVHPLPEASVDEFLNDPYKGWGQEQNTRSSPAYVDVSAIPSATLTVKQGGEKVGDTSWGDVQAKGAVDVPRARVELIDRGKNWVHVTVLDEDTGKPVPCRVHFRSPEGVPFQPYGHHNQANSNLKSSNMDIGGDVRLGQITYAYIDGTCQGWLPRGDVIVDVARGFESEPLRKRVTIEPGQRELTLQIKRWTNMNAQRWFSGDSHVHFLSSQGAMTEAQGEDLNVVNLLQSQWGSLFTNIEDFTGAPNVSQVGDTIVYVSQENRQHFMGHLILWGLKKPVMPWCTNGLGEAEIGGTLEMTMSDWADQCHAQGGTVIAPHIGNLGGETVVLTATGRLDGMELVRMHKAAHDMYYRILNCGYRMPLLAGTDKMSSDVTIGLSRTYVYVPQDEEFNYDNWRKNVAKGRTFATSGPMIGLTVDGHPIGDTVPLTGAGTVEVEAWAEGIFPIHRLDIVQAGQVVASAESRQGTRRLELKERIKVDGHSWLAARCGGPDYFTAGNFSSAQPPSWSLDSLASKTIENTHFDAWRRGIFAHTSPVYVSCGGDWRMFDEETASRMLAAIEGNLTYIREVSVQYEPGTVTHHHGEDDHLAYLERPFLEARQAIRERMDQAGNQ